MTKKWVTVWLIGCRIAVLLGVVILSGALAYTLET